MLIYNCVYIVKYLAYKSADWTRHKMPLSQSLCWNIIYIVGAVQSDRYPLFVHIVILCFYSALVGEQGIAVSLSVCLSMSISLELLDWSSWNFFCTSPVAVARSSSGGIAIRYVLPVLWMTSRLAVVGHDILIPFFHQNLCFLLLPGNKRDQIETLTHCQECHQCMVCYLSGQSDLLYERF